MKFNKLKRIIVVCICLCLVVTSACGKSDTSGDVGEIVKVKYPEVIQYPNEEDYCGVDGMVDYSAYEAAYEKWSTDSRSRIRQSEAHKEGLEQFCYTTMTEFLTASEGENKVYSPLNIYMALSMLAEVTDGNSRAQILDLLGVEDIEALRDKASALWNANYNDDGTVKSVLANSMWLDKNIAYEQDTMNTLAEKYYASSFSGEMGSEEFDRMLQKWLNEQTGGMLEEQAEGVKFNDETILALASTIYYQAKWSSVFSKGNTQKGVFHSAIGDVDCDFMHGMEQNMYYRGDKFGAVAKHFENSGSMWLILPDEGVSVDELIKDEKVMNLVVNSFDWEDKKSAMVNLSMPKFDVSSDIKLKEGLKKLGLTDIFDSNVSDFTPITKDIDRIFVSQASHAARVMVDEEGCVAAAYTVIGMDAEAYPSEEIDFVLDRPFLFILTGADGTPLFAGVVNQPA